MPYSCQHLLDDRDRHTGMFKMKKPTYKKCSEHDKDEDDDDESKQNSTRLSEFHDICSRVARLLPSCPKMYAFRVQRDDTRVVCADISLSGSKYAVGLANSQIDVISIQSQSLFNLQRAVTGSSHVRKFVLDAEYPDTFCESPPPLCSAAQSTLYGHSDAITSVRFCSKDDRLMLSSATDGVVKCWQQHRSGAPKWQTVATYAAHLQPVWSLDVNTLDTHFCTASRDHSVRLFSLDHPQVLRVLAGHQAPVNVVRFHPNCRYVASGANDYSVRLWDILSGRLVRVLVGHVQPVYTLAFSPDGRFLASAGDDRSICIWDLSGGRLLSQVRTVHTQTINSLQFSADGRFLTSASLDQLVCVWNVQSTEATRLEQALVKDTGIALLHIQFAHSDLLLGVGT